MHSCVSQYFFFHIFFIHVYSSPQSVAATAGLQQFVASNQECAGSTSMMLSTHLTKDVDIEIGVNFPRLPLANVADKLIGRFQVVNGHLSATDK